MFSEAGQPLLHGTMCFGGGGKGGGGVAAPAPTYTDPSTGMSYNSASDLNAAIKQRTDAATQAATDATTAANTAAAQKEQAFQTARGNAYNDALNSVMQTFKGAGVDPNNYMSYITPALQRASNSVPDLTTDFTSYFPSGLGSTILNQATTDRRTGLLNNLNSTFTPTYSSTALPDTLLDAPIQSMISQQFDPLQAQLKNALARGTLTQPGYDAALARMNQKETGAQSQLRTLGSNILSTDRAGLDTLASGARSDISGASLGQQIDPSSYASQAASKIGSYTADLPGALQSAAGNSSFADIGDLLNAGGSVQGGNNPMANLAGPGGTVAGASVPGATDDTTKRGLGTTGNF